MKTPRLLVHGEWIETGEWARVVNPWSGEELCRVPMGDSKTLEHAIASSRSAFVQTRKTSAHARSSLLLAIARGIEGRKAEFAETIMREAGKPIVLAEAEVTRAIMTFTACAEEARRQNGEVLDMDAFATGDGHLGMTRRFPIGVIAGIAPFNFPLNLVAHKVAPALATGNCIIVKPAIKCPMSALLLGEVLVEAGVPAGQVNIVTCPNEIVETLVTDDRIAMVSFTGSPAVGWPLKAKAERKKVVLELGGNAAVIVHADADLDKAIPMIASGAFAYAGQSCISVQRMLVHESIYENFRSRFLAHVVEKVRAGDPSDRGTLIGPMINTAAADRVRGIIRSAVSAGANVVLDASGDGSLMGPVILEDVAKTDAASCTELFAPVVTLSRYEKFDDALATVNDSEFGLQAGVFTRDLTLALRAHSELEVGAVLVNQVPTFRVENMPYGGIKDSGFGREGARYAMEDMTEIRALIVRT